MSNVIQMFPVKARRTLEQMDTRDRVGLRFEIDCQQHTINCLIECSVEMDAAHQFVARTMIKKEQTKLDSLIAEYTGKFGPLPR